MTEPADEMAEFTRQLFNRADDEGDLDTGGDEGATPPPPTGGNVAPKEGTGPGRVTHDDSISRFTRQLFGRFDH